MSPSRHGQPRPEVPWRPPCQESAPLALWQLGNTLQVHPDADAKRFLDFLVGCAIDGNVEIGADPVPTTAASVCITPKRRHGPGIEDGNGPTRSTTIYHFPILRRRQVLDGQAEPCDDKAHGEEPAERYQRPNRPSATVSGVPASARRQRAGRRRAWGFAYHRGGSECSGRDRRTDGAGGDT